MPAYRIYRNSTPSIEFTIDAAIAGASLLFTAKAQLTDSYDAALIKKGTDIGGVTITAFGPPAKARVDFVTADSAAFDKRKILHYDLTLFTADGKRFPVEVGQLVYELDVSNVAIPPGPSAPVAPAVTTGTFVQWDDALDASLKWKPSAYALPLLIAPGDVGKALVAISETEATWQTVAGGGPEVDPRLPEHGASDNFLRSDGSEWVSVAVTLATLPASPGDNNRPAVGSSGNLSYPSGNRYSGGADGSDGLDTRIPQKVSTTNATPLTVATFAPPSDCVIGVTAHALAHEAATGDTCRRIRTAAFRVDGGSVGQVGTTTDGDGHEQEDAGAAAWDLTILASGGNVIVQVTGEAAHTISWQPMVQFERLDV